nr:tetratricopeptide repeat protein [Candidatus Sigynarchaeum springense]
MKERFIVNEHIDVVLEDDGNTHVYIDGKQFIQCIRLLLAVPIVDDAGEITSIDDAQKKYGTIYQGKGHEPPVQHLHVDPITEFKGHCSNIQAWVENDYNTRLLHSNIAFPLLKELARAGDAKAKHVLDAELAERVTNGSAVTRKAILETCWDLLEPSLRSSMIEEIPRNERELFWWKIGDDLYASGDMTGAIAAYRAVVKTWASDPQGWYNFPDQNRGRSKVLFTLGLALAKKDDVKEAINAFKGAVKFDPRDGDAWFNLGSLLDDAGDMPAAIEAYREAIKIEPGRADAWNNLSLSLKRAGDIAGAIAASREAIKISPTYVSAWKLLAFYLRSSGDSDGAITAYREAVKLKPNDANIWNEMSCIYTEGGKLDQRVKPDKAASILAEAIDHARRAIDLAPAEGLYHTTLGEALEASGDMDSAIAKYQKALELDPNEKYAIRYLHRLGKPFKESKIESNK